MRTLPANVKTILKSKAQIGDNRPTHRIELEDPPLGTNFAWTSAQTIRGVEGFGDWFEQEGWGEGHFIERKDSKILVTYIGPRPDGTHPFCSVYLSTVDSEDDIFFHHNKSKANEIEFLRENTRVSSKLLRLRSGKILLIVSVDGVQQQKSHVIDCYISDNGLGTDFRYLTRVYEFSEWYNYDVTDPLNVGIPHELPNGRIIFPGFAVTISWAYRGDVLVDCSPSVFYSDDGGNTWNYTILYKAGLFRRPMMVKSIALWGNTLAILVTDGYGIPDTWVYHSHDLGNSWVKGEHYTGNIDWETWGIYSAIQWGKDDGYNYMIIPIDGTTDEFGVFRRPQQNTLPSPFFGKFGTAVDPTLGGTADWEYLAGPRWGDDGYEYIWITDSYNFAFAGTSIYGGGTKSYIMGGKREKEDIAKYVKDISVTRSYGISSSSASITLDNTKGILAPDNANSPWFKKLYPGRKVTIYQGYGQDLITTFTGIIDKCEMSTWPQELTIQCRDMMKVALDQQIMKITYKDMAVEDIFRNLVRRSGLSLGIVDTTGLKISEKTFEWQSYGDAMDWCSELVAFEYFTDEDGLVHFRKQDAKTTIDYTFKEGEDIVQLGYDLDDSELFRKIFVTAQTPNDNHLHAEFTESYYSDLLRVPLKKYMKVDIEETRMTKEVLQGIANRLGQQMKNKVRRVQFRAIANPWLQIGDALQVVESSSTISEVYRILSININQTPSEFTMEFTCYYYKNA